MYLVEVVWLRYVPFTWLIVAAENKKLSSEKQLRQLKEPTTWLHGQKHELNQLQQVVLPQMSSVADDLGTGSCSLPLPLRFLSLASSWKLL